MREFYLVFGSGGWSFLIGFRFLGLRYYFSWLHLFCLVSTPYMSFYAFQIHLRFRPFCVERRNRVIMLPQKQAEEAIVSNFSTEADGHHEPKEEGREEEEENQSMLSVKSFLWHGGSAWDAWFSCASNQVLYYTIISPPKPFYFILFLFFTLNLSNKFIKKKKKNCKIT